MGEITLLLINYGPLSSFIEGDLRILSRHFNVRFIRCISLTDLLRAIAMVPTVDVTYLWFGQKVAAVIIFFSKLFGVRSVVVAGGRDAANMPEIRYGQMSHPINKWWSIYSFRFADVVLAVSNYTRREVLKALNRCPRRVELVYNGVNTKRFFPSGEKERIALTVGRVSWSNLRKKGLLTFVKAARHLPDIKFVLVGEHSDSSAQYLKSVASENVIFTGWLPYEHLVRYYQEAKVYVQVSGHESFGISLAEAMLCEDIPVVTKRAAIPEVVGDTGYYVPFEDSEKTAAEIEKAMSSDKGREARMRIMNMFPIERREQKLVEIINRLTDKG